MLAMQHRMNTRIHEQWVDQNFAWYRAIWIECAELLEHYGYKWWKKQDPDLAQVQLEVIDIWHFGMSALLGTGRSQSDIAADIASQVAEYQYRQLAVPEATETLAQQALETKSFSAQHFWELMLASGLDFEQLYSAYVGKNVLNFFRQDHGYQEGHYQKNWDGREDNEHLVEVVESLDKSADDFAEQIYAALASRYSKLCAVS